MEFKDFVKKINDYLVEIQIELTDKQLTQFYNYMNLLIEWNRKINLTTIIEPEEIILKHFVDSIIISKYIENDLKVIDVGTGAGFPGIPLKIIRGDLDIVLLDSLNKRINFLNEVIKVLQLKNVYSIHARVEEFAKNKKYRESFDIVTSRAVANMSTLSEYMLPLSKVGGKMLAMKGPDFKDEITNSKKALNILGGEIEKIDEYLLPKTDIRRSVILIRKIKSTPQKFPRKPGTPAKEPLI